MVLKMISVEVTPVHDVYGQVSEGTIKACGTLIPLEWVVDEEQRLWLRQTPINEWKPKSLDCAAQI